MKRTNLRIIAFLMSVGLVCSACGDDEQTCECDQCDDIRAEQCDATVQCDALDDADDAAVDSAEDPVVEPVDDLIDDPMDEVVDVVIDDQGTDDGMLDEPDAAEDPDVVEDDAGDAGDAGDEEMTEDVADEEVEYESFAYEPTSALGEFGDCINGCGHPIDLADVIDLTDFPFDGLRGQIDDRSHTYTYNSLEVDGPDIDVLPVTAPGRTMVEIRVEAYPPDAQLDALVLTHDGFQYMTFNSAVSETDISARTVVAAPSVLGLPFYIVITDSGNYERYPTGPWVGGSSYDYVIRFDTWDFDPTDLGELSHLKQGLQVTGASIEAAGDIHYYRFTAPSTDDGARMPIVEFTRTGSSAFGGLLVGHKTIGGDLYWHGWQMDDIEDGSVTLPGSAFRVCNPTPCEGPAEYIFAVTDWNGSAFPGTFSYDLAATLP